MYEQPPVSDIAVARWIQRFNDEHGYSPSVREIAKEFGWRSSSTAHLVLQRLIRKGFVKVETPVRRKLLVKEGL